MSSKNINFVQYKPVSVKPSTLKNDKILKEKINSAAKSIRKKYLALKLGKADEDETLNRLLQPVVNPLRELKNTLGNEMKLKEEKKIPALKLKYKKEVKKEEEEEDDEEEDENTYNQAFLDDYFEQYPSLARKYIEGYFSKRNDYDEKYGVKFNMLTNKLYMGNRELIIGNKSEISIDDKVFDGTDGLYSLLFMKHPKAYSKKDLTDYKHILQLTSAHKRNYDPLEQLAGTRASKYIKIIKPLAERKRRKYQHTETPHASGSGMNMVYNEKPIEYVYWDDVNELVDRLKLLNSSKMAGNIDSHDNEILAIINELREAGIIF